jgi:hypothetical protein
MAAHLAAAGRLQAAVADGRLADARDTARWFASHEMSMPPGGAANVEAMRVAARRIADATDVPTAGAHLGQFGRACASCHEANGASPAFPSGPAPAAGAGPDAQMRRHAWAAARLWEGLIGPADAQWRDGARVMAETPFDAARFVHEKPNVDVVEMAERLHEQATAAMALTDLDARATAYGELMETCASCHAIVRPNPIARRQE